MLDTAKKPFIVSGVSPALAQELAARIKAANVLVAVDFDPMDPKAVAASLIEFKKAAGDSGNLLLTTHEPGQVGRMGMDTPPADVSRARRLDAAKQQLYLALVQAGWTKDEVYSMVGVTPRPSGPMQMPPPGFGRLGGNLAKLQPTSPTT
jgi:hypothetical protein